MRALVIFSFVLLFTACHFRMDRRQLAGIRKIPEFRILSTDSCRCITSESFPMGHPTVLFYFDPDCKHCQRETKNILAHLPQMRNANIYWETNGETDDLKHFSRHFHLDTLTNGMIGSDYEYSFYRAYLPPSVPYMAIYNDRGELRKIYNGEINVNSIIATVNN